MKLEYDVYTPPGGEDLTKCPIILLHGRLNSRATWTRFGQQIAEKTGRKVFAYDARNHGDSPWSDDMDFDILCKDLEDFMDEHGITKAILVGHSMGGRTAITLALKKPEMVERLFVEDMVVEGYSPKVRATVGGIINLLRKALTVIPPDADEMTAKKAVLDFLRSFVPPGSSTGSAMYDTDSLPLKRSGSGYAWQANLDVLEDMLKNRSSQTFSGTYDGEALFLYGNKSFFEVDKDESITKYFPRAVKVCVEGAGHLIHQEHPDEFMKELLKFIT